MNFNKTLNYFTYDFPYRGNDSKFIIDEFNFLSDKFNRVNLIPLKRKKDIIFLKKKNIFVDYNLNNEIFNLKNLPIKLLKIITCKYLWNEIIKLKFRNNFLLKIKIIFTERFLAESIYFYIKNTKVDQTESIYYSFWANHTLLGFFLLKKKKIINFCFSRILGSDLKGFLKNDNYVAFKKEKYQLLNHVIVLNDEQKKILISENLAKKEKIHKNYLGIQTQENSIIKIPIKKIFFASCGSLIHIKNTVEILKFLNVFSKKLIDSEIKYYCIGMGKEKNKILNFAKRSFSKNLKFEYVEKVPKLVTFLDEKKINFFLNFSLSEGVSFAVMEALSCSIPVICSKIPGNTEIIDSQNGYLIDRFSEEVYLDISKKILIDIENNNYSVKALNCKKIISEKLSKKICINQYDKLLKNIIPNS